MSLQNYLYTEYNVPDVLEKYINELSSKGDLQSLMHANKWRSYLARIQDKQYLKEIRSLFNETSNLVEKKHPELKFVIDGRRKSLISTEKKILYYSSQNKSLDLIRDFFAFRIVIYGMDEEDLIKRCYDIAKDIIEFAITKGFTPCDRLPLMGVKSTEEHYNEYFSKFPYKQFVKDYICFKKKNGYESIHFVIVDTKGRHLEVQIRTFKMHSFAEAGEAKHQAYKKDRYDSFYVEREKIKVYGYSYINNTVIDFAGVENGLTVFQHRKS